MQQRCIRCVLNFLFISYVFNSFSSAGTESGAMQTTLIRCYRKTPSGARRPLWTRPSKLSKQILATTLALRMKLSHTVIGHLRQPRLSGLFRPTRYVSLPGFSPHSDCLLLQPIHAFKNLSLKKMLDIGSRATRGVSLPSPKKTRSRIIQMFKQQMFLLWSRLNVSLKILSPSLFLADIHISGPHCDR